MEISIPMKQNNSSIFTLVLETQVHVLLTSAVNLGFHHGTPTSTSCLASLIFMYSQELQRDPPGGANYVTEFLLGGEGDKNKEVKRKLSFCLKGK